MRILILLQIIVYLALPLVKYDFEFYTELYLSSLIFTTGFCLVSFLSLLSHNPKNLKENEFHCHALNENVIFDFIFINVSLILYFYFVYNLNIIDRRVGTEQIAIIFSEIPIYKLIYIRVVDFLFPFVWMYIYLKINREMHFSYLRVLHFFSFFIFVFISGKIFSKSELVFIIISFIIILGGLSTPSVIVKNIKKLIVAFFSIFIIFGVVSYLRFLDYHGSMYEMMNQDFFSRLNGHKIMASLIDRGISTPIGTYDLEIYKYYITQNPFSEQSLEYKSQALTSAKNYLLYDILQFHQFDETTTYLVDVYYFGGLFGVFGVGCFLGGVARVVDKLIRLQGALQNPLLYSIIVALVQSFGRLEFEIIPQCILFFKLAIFYLPIIYFFSRKNQVSL
ncbi:TPA: hypothetical protein I6799_001714 [Vibrio cholerae]|uniref:hypothetical protein n=1 Tax=Vibrio cholerae TaxID=666 RepID=UPI0002C164A3|nr:hypothetical protein [Vibrio cholerae]EMQ57030.1 putative membrane protein [Vibrio cholerae O1 str. EM-1676A]BCN20105.1 putative O-antigen polymerase [Vibrio cholerae]GHZ39784.1 hypothetical protein VCSRO3_2473 [Vibrio cholerae]HAS4283966.1 hypothetical protein [Vibrio cholerae]HAS4302145.1 hypothetical protein [Vibrio cholerae]